MPTITDYLEALDKSLDALNAAVATFDTAHDVTTDKLVAAAMSRLAEADALRETRTALATARARLDDLGAGLRNANHVGN